MLSKLFNSRAHNNHYNQCNTRSPHVFMLEYISKGIISHPAAFLNLLMDCLFCCALRRRLRAKCFNDGDVFGCVAIARKLKAGQPLSEHELYLMVDIYLSGPF